MFYKDDRLGVFINGFNLYQCAKALGFEVDYSRMRDEFKVRGRLMRMGYYTTILDGDDFSPQKPLFDWLSYNGYQLNLKPVREIVDPDGRKRVRGSIDVEMAVDILTMVDRLDHIVIFSGSSDLKAVVDAVKRAGVRVSVAATTRTNPAMVSDDLRRSADNFIDLADLMDQISRNHRDAA